MNSCEVVFLDVAGTLIEVRGSVGEVYSRVAKSHGLDADPSELEREFVAAFRAQSADPCLTPEDADQGEAERRWWRGVVSHVFAERLRGDRFDAYFHEVFEIFRTTEGWRLFPDAVSTLEELRRVGFRLAVVSNFDSRLDDLLPALGIDRFFEQVVLSWRCAAAKPDPRIFRRALDMMGVAADRAVHVGDSVREDAEGASAAGIRAVLLDRRGAHRDWLGGWRVETLPEVVQLLAPDLEERCGRR